MEPVETSSLETDQTYQVFINHRGKDTKKNIASLIYHALEPYGLRVFLDQYVLWPGDKIENEIRGAISSSSVYIAIFSKNYADSRWCLKELCWMLTSSHEPWFIPIFCDVEPSELSFVEKGCYAKAFEKHFQRARDEENTTFKEVEVVEWKEALRKAAGISGKVFKGKEALGKAANNSDTVFEWKESDDHGKLQSDIVNAVLRHVKWDPLELTPHPADPVGLDQAWKYLQDQIKKQSSKKVVVIAGLGGIGKSTLARHIFNKLSRCSEFRRASYLFNVRETNEYDLQRQLCRDLLGKIMLYRWDWKNMLRKSLKGLKVLIVFDDVDDRHKIERVLDVHALEEGSLIFVTSRDKDVVKASYKDTSFVYDVQPLKNKHAREVFCYHASNSLEGCADLVEDFLKICGGLPLCLQVLGKQVSSNSGRAHWERQLKLYSQGASLPEANDVINKLLKWSCKDMDSEERRMLLDVAYFLVGEDKELAVQVLEGLDYMKDVHYSLRRLCQTYLISFKNDVDYHHEERQYSARKAWQNFAWQASQECSAYSERKASRSLSLALAKRSSKLIMHNQVREMARCIVRKDQNEPLRLRWAVDLEKQSESLSRQVRGICIREDQSPSYLPMDINITGVRLLLVEHLIDDLSTFLGSISGNLVWLRWRVSPFISLPSTISVRNLRVLELKGLQDVDLENFFNSIHETPPLELRVVDINLTEGAASSSSSIIAEPDHSLKSLDGNISPTRQFLQSIGISKKNLNKIVLKGVIVERSLPFDFSELKMLRHLDLSGSSNLTALPNSFSKLLQLQHLALRDCTNLDIPVDILGEISTLEHIDFKGCVKLVHLPQGIASQRRLRYLNLLETSLEKLPLTLEPEPPYELEQLIIGSNRFRELSCSVAFLGNLKELFLVGCFELEHISMPIEQLTCLERLEIYGSKLRILPAGISLLKRLKVLTIISCPIEEFTRIDALTELTLIHTRISDLSIPAGACPRLEIVDLSHNHGLRKVEVSQSTIVKLNLKGCENLQHINLPKLGHLKFLNINRCGYVRIQNVAECGSLEEITAEECNFRIEAAWSQLGRLNFFTFSQGLVNFCRTWTQHSESLMTFKKCERARRRLKLKKSTLRDYYDSRGVLENEFKELLNSFNGVTLLEVPSGPAVVLEKVYSHSAILMCFITRFSHFLDNKFCVRFGAYNGDSEPEEFEIKGYNGGEAWVHVYMWTHRSRLLTDEDNFDGNVSICRRSATESGDRGWILTFSSENHVLDALNQIINHSAKVDSAEYGLDSAEYGLDWLFCE